MPLDEIDEDTTVRFVRGSHLWGKWYRPRYFATASNYVTTDQGETDRSKQFEDVPQDDIESDRWDLVQWAVQVSAMDPSIYSVSGSIRK